MLASNHTFSLHLIRFQRFPLIFVWLTEFFLLFFFFCFWCSLIMQPYVLFKHLVLTYFIYFYLDFVEHLWNNFLKNSFYIRFTFENRKKLCAKNKMCLGINLWYRKAKTKCKTRTVANVCVCVEDVPRLLLTFFHNWFSMKRWKWNYIIPFFLLFRNRNSYTFSLYAGYDYKVMINPMFYIGIYV